MEMSKLSEGMDERGGGGMSSQAPDDVQRGAILPRSTNDVHVRSNQAIKS